MSDDISYQARICPWCIDDHSEGRECRIKDLIERVEGLSKERDLWRAEALIARMSIELFSLPVASYDKLNKLDLMLQQKVNKIWFDALRTREEAGLK